MDNVTHMVIIFKGTIMKMGIVLIDNNKKDSVGLVLSCNKIYRKRNKGEKENSCVTGLGGSKFKGRGIHQEKVRNYCGGRCRCGSNRYNNQAEDEFRNDYIEKGTLEALNSRQ